jgi:polyhydroxybutyrate depolymerase
MKTLCLILAGLAVLVTASISTAAQTTMKWTVDGEAREALVFAPGPTTVSIKHPLVFAFHGHRGDMNGASQLMHIQALWPQAIVVYPQGKHRPGPIDPHGNETGWEVEANQPNGVGNKDLDFFDAMLATMHQKFVIDDHRVYATGFSSGAVFSYLLWAERSNSIAAIGEVAGRLWDSEHLTQPRALLAIAGQADTTDPTALQQQTIDAAKQVDNATGPGQPCGQSCLFFPSTSQTPVKTFIHPGGHFYPPGAPLEIVTFFKNHQQL